MFQPKTLACALVVTLAFSTTASADNWPGFRGTAGTGIAEGPSIPTTFTEADYNWSVELNGTGHSSPVVWGDRLFLAIVPEGKEGVRELFCLNTSDGTIVWTHEQEFDPYHNHKFNTSASTTPAVDAERVYLYSASAGTILLQALDHAGTLVWEKKWKGFSMEHGQAASPVLAGDALIIANDQLEDGAGFIMGLDPKTGKKLWEHSRASGKGGYSTPGIAPHPRTKSGQQVIFVSMTYGFTSIDPDTGKVLWKQQPDFALRSVGTPVYDSGVVFATVGSGGGGKDSLALDLESNPEKPEILYRHLKGLPYVPTPIAHNGRIYLWQDSGILRCIDAKSGETIYENRIGEGGNFFSSPILVSGNLWGMSREGRVAVVKEGDTFELIAENDVGSGVHATPAVANGTMFIRTDTHLISLGGR